MSQSDGNASGYALWTELCGREPIPTSAAGRLEIIMELLGGERTDPETGEKWFQSPMITKEQALKLLNMDDLNTINRKIKDELEREVTSGEYKGDVK